MNPWNNTCFGAYWYMLVYIPCSLKGAMDLCWEYSVTSPCHILNKFLWCEFHLIKYHYYFSPFEIKSMIMILICLVLESSEWNLCYFHYSYFSSYRSFKIGIFKLLLLCWIHESYVLKIVELDTSYTEINHNICPYSCNLGAYVHFKSPV